uniref:Uncharacterized protein n=1 Tax=Anopheles christyi TaxID=43041 RepID=A0A182KHS9_9DIPT
MLLGLLWNRCSGISSVGFLLKLIVILCVDLEKSIHIS